MLSRDKMPTFQKIKITADVEKMKEILLENKDTLTPYRDTINETCDPRGPNGNFSTFFDGTYEQVFLQEYEDLGYRPQSRHMTIQKPDLTEKTPDISGEGDERNFQNLRDCLKGTYFEEFFSQFNGGVRRARLCVAKPGGYIKPHIDFNTTIGARYFVPLYTNPWCHFGVKRKNAEQAEVHHFPADGSVWFFNQGFDHGAWNFGKTDRIHLLFTVLSHDELDLS